MSGNILIYSPDLIGHPRIYCRVIADALRHKKCTVTLALGISDDVGLHNSPDLQPLVGRANCSILDCREFSATRSCFLTAEEIVKLQAAISADTTVFIEADKSNEQFQRISDGVAPRLLGHNVGIFAKTAEWYPGEDSFTGARLGLVSRSVRRTLGNIKRTLLNRKQHPRYFYEQTIIRKNVLDRVVVKDERLAQVRGTPVVWMPEISRPERGRNAMAIEDPQNKRIRAEFHRFVTTNAERELILYFGDAAYYKGYDLFLQYANEHSDIAAVHAGQLYDDVQKRYFRFDVEPVRRNLLEQGRLFETQAYVSSDSLKDLFFSSIRFYVSTHRLALSSSTMLQALEQGKPLVVPDRGLLQYRVKTHKLGEVYRYEDLADLDRAIRSMQSRCLNELHPNVQQFWTRFSDDAVRDFWQRLLLADDLTSRPEF